MQMKPRLKRYFRVWVLCPPTFKSNNDGVQAKSRRRPPHSKYELRNYATSMAEWSRSYRKVTKFRRTGIKAAIVGTLFGATTASGKYVLPTVRQLLRIRLSLSM